jgi:hypothetical protein
MLIDSILENSRVIATTIIVAQISREPTNSHLLSKTQRITTTNPGSSQVKKITLSG